MLFSSMWVAGFAVIAAADTGPWPMPDVDNWDAVLAEVHLPSELLLGDGAGGENPRIARARAYLEISGTLATNPPAMFAAMAEAADLAARAGDADLALTALESMGRAFVVPDLAYRMREAVQSATRSIGQRLDSAAPLARAQLRLAEHWVASTNFQAAAASVRAAGELAARIRDTELVGEAAAAGLRVTHARELHSARMALSLNPRDPPANLTVGRHLCYRERNWVEGFRTWRAGPTAPSRSRPAAT
jgi:hypothetical protein